MPPKPAPTDHIEQLLKHLFLGASLAAALYAAIDMRMDKMEGRIEKRVEKIETRIDGIEKFVYQTRNDK